MVVTIFGLGFVGLTTALGFCEMGHTVYGLDVNAERMSLLKDNHLPFFEPYMEDKLVEFQNQRLFLTEEVSEAIEKSDVVYFCVGTPYGANGSADLTYLFSAMDSAVDVIRDDKYRVFVTKSTIPPSTTAEKIVPYLQKKGSIYENIAVANNPEFLREGHCWMDFIEADRIVLGVEEKRAKEILIRLYEPLNVPVFCVTYSTGEFIKYLSNTLLATLISYSNEMAEAADAIGNIEVAEAFKILHMDKRWNGCDMTSYVYPGCGYGGYCLPKDTCAFYSQAKEKGANPKILSEVIQMNENRSSSIASKIAGGLSKTKCIGILGLSFKPDSDDVRDTAAARIIKELNAMGYENIVAYDPVASEIFAKTYSTLKLEYAKDMQEVYQKADKLAIVTAWKEFKDIKELGSKEIVDCRYFL